MLQETRLKPIMPLDVQDQISLKVDTALNASPKPNKKVQIAWASGMSLGLAWAAYDLWNGDYRHSLLGLGVFGTQTLGYAGCLDEKISQQVSPQKNEAKEDRSIFHKFVQLSKDDRMYGLCTLVSLGAITYGVTNGFVTGDFTQAKFGTGLLGMCNLIKGNLSNDDKISKTCIKLGSIASIIFFLSSGDSTSIILKEIDQKTLKCSLYTPSILDIFKKALGFSS